MRAIGIRPRADAHEAADDQAVHQATGRIDQVEPAILGDTTLRERDGLRVEQAEALDRRDGQAGDSRHVRDGSPLRSTGGPADRELSRSGSRRSGVARRAPLRRADRHDALLGAAHELDLERRLEQAEGVVQVIAVGDGVIAGSDDEVAGLDPR